MEADALAKEASANQPTDEFNEVQYLPSVDILEVLQVQNEGSWMAPIISYLKNGTLLEGKDEARKLKVWSARYVLLNDALYKRGFSQPYLRCLSPDDANYVLREVHEGACGNHLEARSLIHKVVLQDITGQPFRQMLRLMSKFVISVSGLVISPDSCRSTLPP